MSEYKSVNIESLAKAMYQRECDYTGQDHGGYCVTENIKTLKSFEDEIERLTTEVIKLREVAQAAFDGWNGGSDIFGPLHRLNDLLARTASGGQSHIDDPSELPQPENSGSLFSIGKKHDSDCSLKLSLEAGRLQGQCNCSLSRRAADERQDNNDNAQPLTGYEIAAVGPAQSNKKDCKWCKFSYAKIKQGREYLYHEESFCEKKWLERTLHKLLQVSDDHMTACDRTMGSSHPCTCGADAAKKLLEV